MLKSHALQSSLALPSPQTIAAKTFKIILKANDKYYEWTLADAITLKSGYRYTLDLTMGNDVALTNCEWLHR